MIVECPNCGRENEVTGDDLPDLACDAEEYECVECEHEFLIGWYATAEIR